MQLGNQKLEQAQCHMLTILGKTISNSPRCHVVSESTARAVAVISQYQKENLRKFCKGRKHKPLEQWPKMTHGWATHAK